LKAQRYSSAFIYLFLLFLLASCSNSKKLEDGKYLLTRNKLEFDEKKPGIESSEIFGLMKQKPNKRFAGVMRFKLWAYNRSQRGRDNGFRRWLENTVGERPTILDTMTAAENCEEIAKYLNNVGYFYSDVGFDVRYKEKSKKAHVTYNISPSVPYLIKDLQYEIEDSYLQSWVLRDTASSLIRKGDIYNVYTLDDERERVARFLNNNGYFGLVKDYIYYEVDSTLGSKEMMVYMKIKNISKPHPDSAGKFIEEPHHRYRISKVNIDPDFDPALQNANRLDYDTLLHVVHQIRDDRPANYYYIIYRDKLRINPKVLSQNILIENAEPYNFRDVSETQKRFRSLNIYKYTNISFNAKADDTTTYLPGQLRPLNCQINLQRAPVHQYSIEAEGTNSGGDLGIGANISYRNRNIFRGGETFQLKLRGAMEAQRSNQAEGDQNTFLFFNTFEYGIEASVTFPRFLVPIRLERFPKYFRPTTTISSGINFRKRTTYDRYIINFIFGYRWNESETKTHIVQPFNISSIKVLPTPEFEEELDEINDPRLRNQYTDHLITALQYSFIFNNQNLKKVKDFIYFKGDIETSGNVFYMFNNLLDSQKDSLGFYKVAGIRYGQYAKLETDFRYYLVPSRTNQVVFRLLSGIGIPYGNSDALPFEKGFYLGGANSMRAWIYRGLGPGAFSDPGTNIDQMGDIVLEGNIEYRFPIYNFFKGALFVDAGNIWLLNKDDSYQDAEFRFNTFYKQIAMDGGLGLRFDFNFFIFRVDFAWRLRDPSQPKGQRWVASRGIWFWNFGIGYPF
jgi:outer membrane protein assembly factor BamA